MRHEAALQQGFDDGAMRHLDGDKELGPSARAFRASRSPRGDLEETESDSICPAEFWRVGRRGDDEPTCSKETRLESAAAVVPAPDRGMTVAAALQAWTIALTAA